MPRIKDEVLRCVVYLYSTEERALRGDVTGVRGTGFLVEDILESAPPDLGWPYQTYVITAGHLIRHGATVVRLMRPRFDEGSCVVFDPETIAVDGSAWVHHPAGDDVAALAIDIDLGRWPHLWKIVNRKFFVGSRGTPHDLGMGDDVFMVGRFINHEGIERNAPVVRFGSIAMTPGPIRQLERDFEQESFLVECRSLPGFSGSPVFAYFPSSFTRDESHWPASQTRGMLSDNVDVYLLGLDWGHIQHEIVTAQQMTVPVNTGMCGVVPAWKIAELLDSEPLKTARAEKVKRLLAERDRSGGRLD